jgi:phage-related protein
VYIIKVLFYETEAGETPVETFIQSLSVKHGARVYWEIELLKEHGRNLKEPCAKQIQGERYQGIRELRIQFAGNISRLLYYMPAGRIAVLLHGFVKKSKKTPQKELETARARMADFQRRYPV